MLAVVDWSCCVRGCLGWALASWAAAWLRPAGWKTTEEQLASCGCRDLSAPAVPSTASSSHRQWQSHTG